MRNVNIYKGDPCEEDCVCISFDEKLEKDTLDMTEGEKKAALIKLCVRKGLNNGLYWAGFGDVIAMGPEYFKKK